MNNLNYYFNICYLVLCALFLSPIVYAQQCVQYSPVSSQDHSFRVPCADNEDLIFYRFSDSRFMSSIAQNDDQGIVYREFKNGSHNVYGYKVTKNGPIEDEDFSISTNYDVNFTTNFNNSPQLPTTKLPADGSPHIELSTSWSPPIGHPDIPNDDYFYLIVSFGGLVNDASGSIHINYTDATDMFFLENWIMPDNVTLGPRSNGQITFKYDGVVGEEYNIYLKFRRAAVPNWKLNFSFTANIYGSASLNETTTLPVTLHRHPHDPNYIMVDKPTTCPCNKYQKLKYKIFFQNEGAGPAVDVKVKVNLGQHLVKSAYTNIQHSHPSASLSSTLHLNGELIFHFTGIHLPGLKQIDYDPNTGQYIKYTYDQTVGWVSFEIPITNCVNNGSITSNAAIIFYGSGGYIAAPIYTNDAVTEINDNQLLNGDFEDGNTSIGSDPNFTTDLEDIVCGSQANSYCVSSNIQDKFTGTPNTVYDHTFGNGSGQFMIIDGHPQSNKNVWQSFQNIVVKNGKYYTFSFWSYVPTLGSTGSPFVTNTKPELKLMVDNQVIKTVSSSHIIYDKWQKHSKTWRADADKTVQLSIQQGASHNLGYDYAIDDIYFSGCIRTRSCYCPNTLLASGKQSTNTNSTTISQMQIFPNPCTNELSIQMPNTNTTERLTVEIFDIQGQKVLEKRNFAHQKAQNTIDTSQLPNGMYLVRIQTPQEIYMQKVLKQ